MSVPCIVLAIAIAGYSGGTPIGPERTSGALAVGSSSSGEEIGATLALRFDGTVHYRDLELRWLRLADSRCPIGVTCVWEGQIVATVEVTRGEEQPVELELELRAGVAPRMSRAFDYALRLQKVEPHPKRGVTVARSDYVARVEIAVARAD